jgi:hypothetical protein
MAPYPNGLSGQMREVTDDHETMHVYVANKTIQAKFVDKMRVVIIDQDLA